MASEGHTWAAAAVAAAASVMSVGATVVGAVICIAGDTLPETQQPKVTKSERYRRQNRTDELQWCMIQES
jgi:hypothetical protein